MHQSTDIMDVRGSMFGQIRWSDNGNEANALCDTSIDAARDMSSHKTIISAVQEISLRFLLVLAVLQLLEEINCQKQPRGDARIFTERL